MKSNMSFRKVGLRLLWISLLTTLNEAAEDSSYWKQLAMDDIAAAQKIVQNTNLAKNILIFIGDGMGMSTITAGRIYRGQKEGKTGEEGTLAFEKFPNIGLIKVADSAATATAFFCGIKSNFNTLGVNEKAKFGVCDPALGNSSLVDSVLQWAQDSGKDTGFLTTTRITHATPAALFAHSNDRDWEADSNIPKLERDKGFCKDVALQMIEDSPGKNTKIILGGGRTFFQNSATTKRRLDGRDLIQEWTDDKQKRGFKRQFIESRDQLLNDELMSNDFVLGLFSPGHLPYTLDRTSANAAVPSLSEMTTTAIKFLQKNKTKGFFLMVEGGRIDHAHHENYGAKALQETMDFSIAIEEAIKLVNISETLIIVTADHSHGFTMNGYPRRGNSILGKIEGTDLEEQGLPFTTLMYATGPGYNKNINATSKDPFKPFKELTNVDTTSNNFVQQSLVQQLVSTHGGEDVPVYAIGPMAHLFNQVHEQSYIAHVMAYSACIGPYATDCQQTKKTLVAPLNTQLKAVETATLFFSALFVISVLLLLLL